MNIISKNDGAKVAYTVRDNRITFDDQLTINLERYERDDAVHIDICQDKYGGLVAGMIPGVAERYVAQLDIPARSYHFEPDGEDAEGRPKQKKVAQPLDMERVTLTLWGMEG